MTQSVVSAEWRKAGHKLVEKERRRRIIRTKRETRIPIEMVRESRKRKPLFTRTKKKGRCQHMAHAYIHLRRWSDEGDIHGRLSAICPRSFVWCLSEGKLSSFSPVQLKGPLGYLSSPYYKTRTYPPPTTDLMESSHKE